MRRRISIFGSTGSIGRNTVALVEAQGGAEAYEVVALSGARNVALLAEQAIRLGARRAVTSEPDSCPSSTRALAGTGAAPPPGRRRSRRPRPSAPTGRCRRSSAPRASPSASPPPPWRRARARQQGEPRLRRRAAARLCAEHGTTLLPVDSEHSAIFQACAASGRRGGRAHHPHRVGRAVPHLEPPAMLDVTPAQARAHPNWDMGERISIDSASMFNKALEVIEAHELFGIAARPDRGARSTPSRSCIRWSASRRLGDRPDGALRHARADRLRAQLAGAAAARGRARLDFARSASSTSRPSTPRRFPALRLAREVLEIGGLAGAVFNAGKEVALDAFIARSGSVSLTWRYSWNMS
jgi:1-deoxy-D-xylulose-5-phosphate reductoisomerase